MLMVILAAFSVRCLEPAKHHWHCVPFRVSHGLINVRLHEMLVAPVLALRLKKDRGLQPRSEVLTPPAHSCSTRCPISAHSGCSFA